jgi:hypothetical protein
MKGVYPIIFLLLTAFAFIGIALFISGVMTKRAISRVLNIFRKNNALGVQQAQTLTELGLQPPNLLQRFTQARDYKQNALKIMIQAEIIRVTEDGKLFLPQEKYNELLAKGILKHQN